MSAELVIFRAVSTARLVGGAHLSPARAARSTPAASPFLPGTRPASGFLNKIADA